MKTILALSDTHGDRRAVLALRSRMEEADYVFHLGDHARDMAFLAASLGDKLISVPGNCDGTECARYRTVDIEGVRILLTHGHRLGVKQDLTRLAYAMDEAETAYAVFGHTHHAGVFCEGGKTMINPGAFVAPLSGEKSYAYLTVYNGRVLAKIVTI